jgi:hypothetical protein
MRREARRARRGRSACISAARGGCFRGGGLRGGGLRRQVSTPPFVRLLVVRARAFRSYAEGFFSTVGVGPLCKAYVLGGLLAVRAGIELRVLENTLAFALGCWLDQGARPATFLLLHGSVRASTGTWRGGSDGRYWGMCRWGTLKGAPCFLLLLELIVIVLWV